MSKKNNWKPRIIERQAPSNLETRAHASCNIPTRQRTAKRIEAQNFKGT